MTLAITIETALARKRGSATGTPPPALNKPRKAHAGLAITAVMAVATLACGVFAGMGYATLVDDKAIREVFVPIMQEHALNRLPCYDRIAGTACK